MRFLCHRFFSFTHVTLSNGTTGAQVEKNALLQQASFLSMNIQTVRCRLSLIFVPLASFHFSRAQNPPAFCSRQKAGLEIKVGALNTSQFLYIRPTTGETVDFHLTTAFNIRLKSFLKHWLNPISVDFLCVQQVKHNERGRPFWSCSKRIQEEDLSQRQYGMSRSLSCFWSAILTAVSTWMIYAVRCSGGTLELRTRSLNLYTFFKVNFC